MCHTLDSLYTALPVALGVDDYSLRERAILVDGDVQQILDGVDSLALLTDKKTSLLRHHIHGDSIPGIMGVNSSVDAHGVYQGGSKLVHSQDKVLRCFYSKPTIVFFNDLRRLHLQRFLRPLFDRRLDSSLASVLDPTILLVAGQGNISLRSGVSNQYAGVSRAYTQEARAPLIKDLKIEPVTWNAECRRSLLCSLFDCCSIKLPTVVHFFFFLLRFLLADLATCVPPLPALSCAPAPPPLVEPLARWPPADVFSFSSAFS